MTVPSALMGTSWRPTGPVGIISVKVPKHTFIKHETAGGHKGLGVLGDDGPREALFDEVQGLMGTRMIGELRRMSH